MNHQVFQGIGPSQGSRRHLVDLQVQGPNHAELRHRRQGWPGRFLGYDLRWLEATEIG